MTDSRNRSKSSAGGKRVGKAGGTALPEAFGKPAYLSEAPAPLVALHESGKVRKGRAVLARLVGWAELSEAQRSDLGKAWKDLAVHLQTDTQCRRLWGNIAHLYSEAKRKPQSIAKRRDALREIARKVRELREAIDGDRDLDRLVFEFFDSETHAINGIAGWDQLDPIARSVAAQGAMSRALLNELAVAARVEHATRPCG